MIFLTHGLNRTWIPSLSKPSTIGWSFRMDHARRILTAASKARRLRYSIDENDGSEVATWHSFPAETQQRWWTEEYWTGHVNEEYTADSLINAQHTKSAAMTSLESQHLEAATQHVSSLKIQGKSFNSIREAFDEKTINSWSSMINDLLRKGCSYSSGRHFSNSCRRPRICSDGRRRIPICVNYVDPSRPTNTRWTIALSAALTRYKSRHDHVLSILAQWITSVVKDGSAVFVDLDEPTYKPLSELFVSLRPDIAIKPRTGYQH